MSNTRQQLSNNVNTDALPLALGQKLTAFREFLSATNALKGLLLSQDMNRVNALIDHRQELISRIDDLDNRIQDITAPSATFSAGMTQEKGSTINALSAAIEETVAKVIQLNEDCATIAMSHRDELEKELPGISKGRLALRGYAGGKNGIKRPPRLLSIKT